MFLCFIFYFIFHTFINIFSIYIFFTCFKTQLLLYMRPGLGFGHPVVVAARGADVVCFLIVLQLFLLILAVLGRGGWTPRPLCGGGGSGC